MGKSYLIETSHQRFLKHKVIMGNDRIMLFLSEEQVVSQANTILKEYIIKFARNYITERCKFYAKKHNLEFNNIAIKEQKTRWGSCSSSKNLNFNWRLIFANKEVVDYVIIHELCHTKEMNHKPQFWSLVKEIMSDYQIHQQWLKDNGRELWELFD